MDHEQTPQAATSAPNAPSTQAQAVGEAEQIQIIVPDSGDTNGVAGRERTQTPSTERHLLTGVSEGYPTLPRPGENPIADFERVPFPPGVRSRDGHGRALSRRNLISMNGLPAPPANGNGLDWIVPIDEKSHIPRTIGERLEPTIKNATDERDKYARRAVMTGYALNIAIGLQVFFGALTTAIAAGLTNPKQARGLTTLIASYLARARGSGEPEASQAKVKNLEQFLRECLAFKLDHAHEYGNPELDMRLMDLRRRFEELLGNLNPERKGISPTVKPPPL